MRISTLRKGVMLLMWLIALSATTSAFGIDVPTPALPTGIRVTAFFPTPGTSAPCLIEPSFLAWTVDHTSAELAPSTGYLTIIRTKGVGCAWGGETWFFDSDGALKGVDDAHWGNNSYTDGSTCFPLDAYRVFRDVSSGRKGFQWCVARVPANGDDAYWAVDHYVEEHWMSGSQPACWGDHHTNEDGSVTGGNARLVWLYGYLYDGRAQPRWSGAIDVQAIESTTYPGSHVETHWYGRYRDPQTNQWIALGEVNFSFDNDGPSTAKYLVDCTAYLQCHTWPDP